jgi:hypothetical protein
MVLKQHQKMHVIELEEELGVVQCCNAAVQVVVVVVVQNSYILLIRK